MSYILISLVLVALSVFLLSFNIIFRKGGKFPEREVGQNRQMRKLGIKCAKAEERELWSSGKNKRCLSCSCSTNCENC